jgi:kumamolisin
MAAIPKNYIVLEGSERRPGPRAKHVGPARDRDAVEVTIIVRRRPDGPPVPDHSFYRDTPPSRRPRMSPDEFAARFGADTGDIAKITDFAKRHGLKVGEMHAGRRSIALAGTVAQMNAAFGVSLQLYEDDAPARRGAKPGRETYRGRDGFIHVPEELAGIIVGVFGLDNRRISKRNAADPPNTNPISLAQVTSLYQFPGNLAAGQTIAIFSEGGYLPADIAANFPVNPPVVTDVAVDAGNGGFADPETTQDIVIAASAAPGATIAVYFTVYTQKGWVDLINRVVHPSPGDPVCSVLSSSFYVSNGDDTNTLLTEGVSVSWLTAASQAFEDAAIQGVTMCIASGDTGTDSKVGDGKAHVQYPASDPWVLAVGGTTIGNIVGSTFDEFVWNDTFFGGIPGATGGGVSDLFPRPYYQVDAGVPGSLNDGHSGRAVPDVAANASPNSGYPIIVGGAPFVGNGTSASAPLWAGLIATLNAALDQSVGFVNPVLYAIGSSGFRDIVGVPGAADNGLNGVPGYPARVGWDACTGWGSPRGVALLKGLQRFYGPVIAVDAHHNLAFGTVCDAPQYLQLEVFNVGTRPLSILSVTRLAGSTAFTVLHAPATPLAIAPGDHVDFTVEFNPTARNVPLAATIRIVSDDVLHPHLDLNASGLLGAGSLETVIADHGQFGKVCRGSFRDLPLTVNNNGPCRVHVLNVASSSSEFVPPAVNRYPLTIAPGVSLCLPLRFAPAHLGTRTATITITSDDPAGPKTVAVSGEVPPGKLAVCGSTYFGEVDCGIAQKTLSLCNVGECDLNVEHVRFKRKRRLFTLINNPFPATLRPGVCLCVVIQYRAHCEPECCELEIVSDDPAEPVKTLDVVAYTRCEKPCRNSCDRCDCAHEEDSPCEEH